MTLAGVGQGAEGAVSQLLPSGQPEKKGRCYDLYAPADIDALTPEQVRPVIEERVAWLDRSLSLTRLRNRWTGTTAS